MGLYILTIIHGGQPVFEKNRCVFDLKWDTDGLQKTLDSFETQNILDSCGAENTKAHSNLLHSISSSFFCPQLFFPDG